MDSPLSAANTLAFSDQRLLPLSRAPGRLEHQGGWAEVPMRILGSRGAEPLSARQISTGCVPNRRAKAGGLERISRLF